MMRLSGNRYAVIAMALIAMTVSSCSSLRKTSSLSRGEYQEIMVDSFPAVSVAATPVPLESLLDRSQTTYDTFKQYRFKEIPFKRNADPSYAILGYVSPDETCTLSPICLFLLETTDTTTNDVERKIITMIPAKEYMDKHTDGKYSYVDKGVYSGVVFYSNLDGSFRNVYVYGGDFCPIINAQIVDESAKDAMFRYGYVYLVGQPVPESPDGSVTIDRRICIGDNRHMYKDSDGSLDIWYGGKR